METVQKSFLGLFFLLLLVVLLTGILSMQVRVSNARDYHADAVAEIENSNFSPRVINACVQEAKSLGYDMKVTLYREEARAEVVTQQNPAKNTQEVYLASVEMEYPYQFLFLNLDEKKSVRAFAR
ncbi:MAG: hypothetical protein ACI4HI_00255 [Lachnospiraceae bacterium]